MATYRQAKDCLAEFLKEDPRVNGVGITGNLVLGYKIIVLLTEHWAEWPTFLPQEVKGWPVVFEYTGEVRQGG